ncbi:hypothetical protein LINPERHAP2_LOCUS40254 [Linum perenne]
MGAWLQKGEAPSGLIGRDTASSSN